ncbi:MAG: nucleotidyl transferase AbiEii/AbiGii toxin family protein [Pseudomonadota bacterium]
MLSQDNAKELSRRLNIDLFTVCREYLQLLFLKYFYAQKETDRVFFKGGTALRFLYESFRFSEDLDFTSLISGDELTRLVERALKNLGRELENVRFRREGTHPQSFGGRLLQDLPMFKSPLTVKLDFSLREKPVRTDVSLIETQFPLSPYPRVSHLTVDEMMAETIRAIATRVRGRDVFDLWFLLSKKVRIDWEIVERKMEIYRETVDAGKLIGLIEQMPPEEIRNDLTRFLPLSHRTMVNDLRDSTLKKLREKGVTPNE